MRDDNDEYPRNWNYAEGWCRSRGHLSSLFMLALSVSYGLSPDEIDRLADQCGVLALCFEFIASEERYCSEE